MFNRTPKNPSRLDSVMDQVLMQLEGDDAATEEFATRVDQLTKLNEIKKTNLPDRVSKETLATIGANLAGICVIVGHERAHVITTKALGFIMKAR